jgi:hypothetical protein
MAVERKPLKKAPIRDVVEAFTAPPVATPVPAEPQVGAAAQADKAETDLAQVRRGAGRPRSKRRMEPFSSKIEIDLRDQVDYYLAEHGGTMVDFLDAALRDRLQK